MASATRIAAVSTAVEMARGIAPVKQRRGMSFKFGSIHRDLSSAVMPVPRWSTIHSNKKNLFSTYNNSGHDFGEIGNSVDVADLLSSPERDFLVKNNGQKVPISSLEGKLVGLYFCDNIPHPPRMQAIKKVYEEAKSRGYDFEIVQITFHYRCNFNAKHLGIDPRVRQCKEDISWLTLPFKDPTDPVDPSYTKIQSIFECVNNDRKIRWVGDSLVLVYPRQAQAEAYDSSGVLFEFSGAEILARWGIEGYPFTRPSLYKAEYEIQKREITLQHVFPPGEGLLRRPRSAGGGFDLVDSFSQLSGKRVLVFFAPCFEREEGHDYFLSMLKSEYEAQVGDDSKFEVVYVSTGPCPESEFDETTRDMPWLVQPFRPKLNSEVYFQVFLSHPEYPAAVAFNERGELIAKEVLVGENKGGDKLGFPFIDRDLEKRIRREVEALRIL